MKKGIVLVLSLISIFLISCKDDINKNNGRYAYTLVKDSQDGKVYCPDADYVICLEKDPNKDFVILNLGDVQEGNENIASNLLNTIDALVQTVHPDLITLTGDISYGDERTIKSIAAVLDKYKIPWAPVLGNHDHNEVYTSVEDQSKLYESFEYCLFKTGPELGTTNNGNVVKAGNYVINIVENTESGFDVLKTLIFMDTGDSVSGSQKANGRRRYNNGYNWDCLNSLQLQFYQDCYNAASRYSEDELSSVIFIHIPIFAYVDAIGAALKTDISVFNVNEFNNYAATISYADSFNASIWNEGYKNSFGVMHEPVGSAQYDDCVFEVIKDSTDCIISGHEHINNFVINYQGVRLCYTMKTGFGSYHDESMNGGTVLAIDNSGSVSIRHELVTLK